MDTSKLRRGVWVVASGLIVIVSARAEVIGPYDIAATPSSATLVAGGGAAFNWLNVVNSPVTIASRPRAAPSA